MTVAIAFIYKTAPNSLAFPQILVDSVIQDFYRKFTVIGSRYNIQFFSAFLSFVTVSSPARNKPFSIYSRFVFFLKKDTNINL